MESCVIWFEICKSSRFFTTETMVKPVRVDTFNCVLTCLRGIVEQCRHFSFHCGRVARGFLLKLGNSFFFLARTGTNTGTPRKEESRDDPQRSWDLGPPQAAWRGAVRCASLRGPFCAGEALLEARTQASVALFKLGAHCLRYAPTRIWRAYKFKVLLHKRGRTQGAAHAKS